VGLEVVIPAEEEEREHIQTTPEPKEDLEYWF
jgi:hypothetical protein